MNIRNNILHYQTMNLIKNYSGLHNIQNIDCLFSAVLLTHGSELTEHESLTHFQIAAFKYNKKHIFCIFLC